MTPYYQKNNVTLYLGDCVEVMREMPDKSIDAVITDPPYGIGIAANPFRQKYAKAKWDDQPATPEHISEIMRISTEQIIWGGNYFQLNPSQGFLVWDKVQPFDFSSAMCEQAWISKQQPAKIFRYKVTNYSKEHPTQKPLPLMVWCIGFVSGNTILDPFMGSGTTGVACIKTNRQFIGIEISEEYCELSAKRIEAAFAQPMLDLEVA